VVHGMLDKQRLRTFVLGGVAGALVGILFAPRSGKELRGSITSRAGEARERGRETYFEAQERVQERFSEAREGPFSPGEARIEEDVMEPLPKLGPAAPEPMLDSETLAGTPPDPLPLRDVSWDAPRSVSREDPEEIRRKIRETRSRLRERLEAPEPEDAPEDRDG
jgi:gas vesicle protein